jgi:hypothetical protein
MFDDDPLSCGLIQAMVGDELRVIPMAVFQDVFEEKSPRHDRGESKPVKPLWPITGGTHFK